MSTLMAVILCLVDLDATARCDCEVRCVHCLSHVHPRSNRPRPQAQYAFQFVSAPCLSAAIPSLRNGRLSVILLSFHFQLFPYLAFAAASLLIVLRMYVLCNLAIRSSIVHAYRQHRHMEQTEVRHGDRGWRMGGQCWVPHRRCALSSCLLHIISI